MWQQFFFEHGHFTLNVFSSLLLFAVGWLYIDAWTVKKTLRDGLRAVGFCLLSLSFLFHGVSPEQTDVIIPLLSWLLAASKLSGYLLIIASLIIDPINPVPELTVKRKRSLSVVILSPLSVFSIGASPLLACVTGFLFLYRATAGLERHLRGIAIGMLFLGLYEVFALRSIFLNTTDIGLYDLLKPYGLLWWIEHIVLSISVVCIARWVFGYLLKRFDTQLFLFLTSSFVIVFLLTTMTFTGLVVKNLTDTSIDELTINAGLFTVLMNTQIDRIRSYTDMIATTTTFDRSAKRNEIAQQIQRSMLSGKLSGLVMTDEKGIVIADGERLDNFGFSLAHLPIIQKSLQTQTTTINRSVDTTLVLPSLELTVASVRPNQQGVVMSTSAIDQALLDGVKKETGLDASIYAGKILSATTLLSPDGQQKAVGISETNTELLDQVYTKKQPWSGIVRLLNREYISTYTPIQDMNGDVIGMTMIARPTAHILALAQQGTQRTFLVSTIFMILSIIPSYLMTRSIVKQIK